MKNIVKIVVIILIISSISALFTGCSFLEEIFDRDKEKNEENIQPPVEEEYVIQYTDEDGTHRLTVKSGELYSIDRIPQKRGYKFVGLFDSESGGTQYVNASGSALAPFTDNTNLILFPRFAPNEYIMVLDYQGAQVTGDRQIRVSYGSQIVTLPVNVNKENMEFVGWFTKPDRQGKQISDKNGVIPGNAMVSETNFDLSNPDAIIYLYAGFVYADIPVTFYYGQEEYSTTVKYGTNISEVDVKLRKDNMQVVAWSLSSVNPEEKIFEGDIVEEVSLYAAKYSPYLDLDPNGGSIKQNTFTADIGEALNLPVPTKIGKIFVCWKDQNGNIFSDKIMPATSMKLTAMWSEDATYTRNSSHNITDSGRKNQHKDQLVFSELFGLSLEQLRQKGYENVKFEISIRVKEIDDGNQYWYLSRNDAGTDNISERFFEHGSGYKETSSWWHDFTVDTSLSSCRDTLYLMYGADGWFSDTWKNEAVRVKIILY